MGTAALGLTFSLAQTWLVSTPVDNSLNEANSADLIKFTGIAFAHGRIPFLKMLQHWFLCFWGNMAGCLFVLAIIIGCKCHQMLLYRPYHQLGPNFP